MNSKKSILLFFVETKIIIQQEKYLSLYILY